MYIYHYYIFSAVWKTIPRLPPFNFSVIHSYTTTKLIVYVVRFSKTVVLKVESRARITGRFLIHSHWWGKWEIERPKRFQCVGLRMRWSMYICMLYRKNEEIKMRVQSFVVSIERHFIDETKGSISKISTLSLFHITWKSLQRGTFNHITHIKRIALPCKLSKYLSPTPQQRKVRAFEFSLTHSSWSYHSNTMRFTSTISLTSNHSYVLHINHTQTPLSLSLKHTRLKHTNTPHPTS